MEERGRGGQAPGLAVWEASALSVGTELPRLVLVLSTEY